MAATEKYIDTPTKLKNIIRFIDGIALRYIPMFFILGIANGLVLKTVFDQKVTSNLTLLFLWFTTLVVSIVWTHLALKTEFSVFHRPLASYIKKDALSKRGIRIVIYYLILKSIRSSEASSDIFINASRKLIEFSFAFTILVLIATFIIIALRKPLKS